MSDSSSQPRKSLLKRLVGKFIDSKFAGILANTPPFSWILQRITHYLLKDRLNNKIVTSRERTHNIGLEAALEGIVQDVVDVFGYVGAMVATYDPLDDALPVKAFYIDERLATKEDITKFENSISDYTTEPISLSNQKLARVHVHKDEDGNNLGVKAFHKHERIKSDSLFDLFTPIIPKSGKPVVEAIQQQLHIKEVITVPFFLDALIDGIPQKEFVGNLFVAKREIISEHDELVLSTLGQYVASLIQSENRRQLVEIIDNLILDIQKNLTSEDQVLQRIVQGIVKDLGYLGAMVAPYEAEEKALPIKALAFDENDKFLSLEKIKEMERQVSQLTSEPVSITDPNLARVYLDQPKYESNLSIIAAKSGRPEKREAIYDLFTPFAPPSSKGIIDEVQATLGVHRVIAVPFFLESLGGKKELVGNLFALSRSYEITDWEIEVLQAFGQQAAAGLRNVRLYRETEELLKKTELLYRKAEDRRQASEIFGKMAFTASASVHALRNHLAPIKGNLQLVSMLDQMDENTKKSVMEQIPNTLKRLEEMRQLIESLHEPWRPINDTTVNINACIKRALDKVFPVEDRAWIQLSLSEAPLELKTTPEMLTEAFKVLVKNAKEALQDQTEENRTLYIESKLSGNLAEVIIRDNGMGISPENLEKVFEMRFTTKTSGLGFGLFWARDYVNGLGGSINVSSVERQGTTFSVALPLQLQVSDLQSEGASQ